MADKSTLPILIPMELDQFWEKMRLLIREEIQYLEKGQPVIKEKQPLLKENLFQTSGLSYKPLYKLREMCDLLQVSRTTIYEWIKKGTLKPYKIRSRVYFLWDDVQKLLNPPLTNK